MAGRRIFNEQDARRGLAGVRSAGAWARSYGNQKLRQTLRSEYRAGRVTVTNNTTLTSLIVAHAIVTIA